MKTKIKALLLADKEHNFKLDLETEEVAVEIDLQDVNEKDMSNYLAQEDYIHIDDIQYDLSASRHGYIQEEDCEEITLDNFSEREIIDYMNTFYFPNPIKYPNNSLRTSLAYSSLFRGIDKISIEEIEGLIKKYDL